jgi:hypothetical protein
MTAPPPPSVRPPGTKWRWTIGLLSLAVVIVTGVVAVRYVVRTSRDINTAKVGDCVEPDSPHNLATWHRSRCTGSGDFLVIARLDRQVRPPDDAALQQLCRGFDEFAGGIWVGPSAGPGFVLCFVMTGK